MEFSAKHRKKYNDYDENPIERKPIMQIVKTTRKVVFRTVMVITLMILATAVVTSVATASLMQR